MDMKVCKSCERSLPLTQFHQRKDRNTASAYRTSCRECTAVSQARRYQENKAHHNSVVKAHYESIGRFARYGITKEEYDRLLTSQDGKCKLCGVTEPGGKGKWHIDHKHSDGYKRNVFNQCKAEDVRGLLCHNCNVSLGHYEKLASRVGAEALHKYLIGNP